MQVASCEENQQLAAPTAAAAATVFCHFRVYYKLNIISLYIWIDFRLKGLFIECKNTHNEGFMQFASREENQQLAAPAAASAATVFCHFQMYYKLNIISIYIWIDSRLKGISIESKNTYNGVLTKELCKLQAVKKISNLQHLQQQQQPLSFVIFGCTISSILYQYIYIYMDRF